MQPPKTLAGAIRYFANPDHCCEYLVARRWPNGVVCPECGSDTVYFDRSRNGWECKTRHPKRKFTLKTGTIFEDSALGLDKWLPVLWMIANTKNGVSSHEIARSVGVTQKTGWFMLHRVRLAMQDDLGESSRAHSKPTKTYIGAKARNMHHGKRKTLRVKPRRSFVGKVAVIGLLERHGEKNLRVNLHVLHRLKRKALQGILREYVEPGSELNTDAFPSYTGLTADYPHKVTDHAETFMDGTKHTNGCENFSSLLKRGLNGT